MPELEYRWARRIGKPLTAALAALLRPSGAALGDWQLRADAVGRVRGAGDGGCDKPGGTARIGARCAGWAQGHHARVLARASAETVSGAAAPPPRASRRGLAAAS